MQTISRKDYVSGKVTHQEYYGQFVTQDIKDLVLRRVSIKSIVKSEDNHFNNIDLAVWDRLHPIISQYTGRNCLSDSVCIAKEAARQLKEELKQCP